jgi:hypothetical protein
VRIAVESTIPATEKALAEIATSAGEESLFLPLGLRYLAGGAEVALAQVIISWAQRNPAGTLKTYITSLGQIDSFVRRLPGLVAALCARQAFGRGDESIFTDVRSASLERLHKLQSNRPKEGYRGRSAEIVCADHLGLDTPYLLYQRSPSGATCLRPRENFRDLARWLLGKSIQGSFRDENEFSKTSDAIGAMLFEIFKNTEDHGLVDVAGNALAISIRAIKTNHHALLPGNLDSIVGDFPPLAGYCSSLVPPTGGAQVQLFELSVLDSGPGFAATWRKRSYEDMDLTEEEEATRACFGRGSAKGQGRFGEGLPHVLRLLRLQQGFLRLRTGRLSFFIDFSRDIQEGTEAEALERFELQSGPNIALAAGSLLSILIPMRRNRELTF